MNCVIDKTTDISVIIPTYNRADLLVKAIRSALDQTISPLEVLVCDDGSTDGSEKAVKSIGDSRVRWVVGPRGGRPALPRNRGIRESKGGWLAFLDSDDIWLPDKLEKQLKLAEELNCHAVCSNAFHFVPAKGVVGTYLNWKSDRVSFDELLKVNRVICSSTMIRRELIRSVIGFPEDTNLKVGEDYSLWLRVASQTDFAFSVDPLLFYLDDAANSVRCDLVDDRMARVAAFCNFIQWGLQRKLRFYYIRKAMVQATIDFTFFKINPITWRLKKIKKKFCKIKNNPNKK